jgi:hypothetical protein
MQQRLTNDNKYAHYDLYTTTDSLMCIPVYLYEVNKMEEMEHTVLTTNDFNVITHTNDVIENHVNIMHIL